MKVRAQNIREYLWQQKTLPLTLQSKGIIPTAPLPEKLVRIVPNLKANQLRQIR